MGHYLSEMEGPEEADDRYRGAMVMQGLQQRGYWSPGAKGPRSSWHHVPCGLAVFDSKTHEQFCPAK